jgi:hypothetical protein
MDVNNLTVEAWIKPDDVSATRQIVLRDGSTRCWIFRITAAGRIDFAVWNTSGTLYQATTAASTISAGTKYHVVGVFDGSTAKVYVNGVESASVAVTGTVRTSASEPIIVAGPGSAERFDGVLDEVAVYGTALSPARVLAHYEAGTALGAYTSELMLDSPWGYWKNNETSGTTLADSSGNSKPMTTALSPTLNQSGPVTSMKSVDYPGGTDALARTDVSTGLFGSAACTIETWVYVPASATMGKTPIVATMSESTSSALIALMLAINASGQLVVEANTVSLASSTAIARDTWYHVVGSVGAAGLKLRVNKTTEALDTGKTSTDTTSYAVFQRREKNSTGTGADWRAKTQVRIGPTSIYASQLSDARTDAHFNASGYTLPAPQVTASLTGSGAFTATVVEVEKRAANLAGSGAFTATQVQIESRSASLIGSGAFTATSRQVVSVTGEMAGTGTFTATSKAVGVVTAQYAGSGEFTATIDTSTAPERAANLTGSGAFTATSYPVFAVAASLTGSASLTATSVAVHAATGQMTGAGTFSASIVVVEVVSVTGSFTGSGAFTATSVEVEVYSVAASLTGTGGFTATASAIARVAANLSGSGAFVSGGFQGMPLVSGFIRLSGSSSASLLTLNTVVGWIVLTDGTQEKMERSEQVLVDAPSADTLIPWQNGGETIVVSPVLS